MDPFTLNKSARNLKDRYPTLSQLKEFYKAADPSEVLGACRAWLTEGIPGLSLMNHYFLKRFEN